MLMPGDLAYMRLSSLTNLHFIDVPVGTSLFRFQSYGRDNLFPHGHLYSYPLSSYAHVFRVGAQSGERG